jgi:Tfp pilus assembly protein PilO
MIAILATITILMGVFFFAILYYPVKKRANLTARLRTNFEAQVGEISPQGGQTDQEAATSDAMDMDINFFKQRNLSPREGIPELLEQINRMGNQMNIRFVAVKPLEEEDAPEYRRYPFLIETRSAYPELVTFVHRIEDAMRLSLDGLRIEADEKNPFTHRLQFTLNIYELKEDLTTGQVQSVQTQIDPPINMERSVVHRDPFSPKKGPDLLQVRNEPKPKRVMAKKPKRPKLVLMGIVDVGGSRQAIINNKILRAGEMIGGQRIDRIADDHVVLGEGDKTHLLYLINLSPSKGREVQQ